MVDSITAEVKGVRTKRLPPRKGVHKVRLRRVDNKGTGLFERLFHRLDGRNELSLYLEENPGWSKGDVISLDVQHHGAKERGGSR